MILQRLAFARLALAAAVASGAFAAPAASQTSCVAAGCVPPPESFLPGVIFGGFNSGAYIPGQTFKPLFRGVLKEVRLGLHNADAPGDTTRVVAEVRAVAGGFPSGPVLARALVAGAPYVGGHLYTASFPNAQLVLEPGTLYAITLRTSSPNVVYILARFPGCGSWTGSINPVHSYDGGTTWGYAWSPAERSFAYEVCVDAVTPTVRSTWGRLKAAYR